MNGTYTTDQPIGFDTPPPPSRVRLAEPRDGALLRICGEEGDDLLVLHQDGTVEGEIENASEAAAVFVQEVRNFWQSLAPTGR